ncbi:hypothetical protein JXL83_08205 [candidate division WOR-3 bacterium]|nr:hypothetical protein [candidate division WOR-3 bacterium]
MLDFLNKLLTSHSLHIGLFFIVSGAAASFFGNAVFKYFLFLAGAASGLVLGALAGINYSYNYTVIILLGIFGAAVFSLTFFLYRTIAIFFIGFALPLFLLVSIFRLNIVLTASISLISGVLTVLMRRFMLSGWLSISGALMLFLGFSFLLKEQASLTVYGTAALLIAVIGFFVQIKRRKKSKKNRTDPADQPNS